MPSSPDFRQEALDVAPLAMVVYGPDERILFLNAHAAAHLERAGFPSAEQVVGRRWEEAFPHLAETSFPELLRATSRDGGPGELDVPSFQGRARHHLRLRGLSGGAVAVFIQPHEELSERHPALRTALETEERTRAEHLALVEGYPFGSVASFDEGFRYRAVAGRGWAGLGVEPDSLVGRTFGEVWDPETAAGLEELARVGLAGFEAEQRIRYEERVWEIWVGPMPPSPDGGRRGMFLSRDVTAEVGHAQRVHLLEQAADAAQAGIFLVGLEEPHHPVVYASRGFERLTGYTVAEILGQSFSILHGAATDDTLTRELERAVDERRPFQGTLVSYRKDGTSFWNRLTLTPFSPDGRSVTHYVGIQEDVTEVRRTEREREHQRRLAELGTLAGSVAHDFNNLLMEIQGRLAICREDPARSDLADELGGIETAARRGTSLVGQLLAYAHHHDETLPDRGAATLVRDLVPAVTRLLPRNVRVHLEGPEDPLPVAMATLHLERVLLNLAKNAADAMPGGGVLHVGIAPGPGPDRVTLTVTDQGVGMSEDVRSRAFEPFFTTKGSGGTGLGLSSVKRIVDRVGGSIEVRSHPGEGTTFELRLPRAGGGRTTAPEALPAPARDRALGLEGLRLLLADDQEGIRHTLGLLLERRGLLVTTATDGADALEKARAAEVPFDIVLADRDMPRMMGDQLLRSIAELHPEPLARPWLLLMSGQLPETLADLPPGTVLVSKPFEIPDLLRLLSDTVTGRSDIAAE